VFSVVVEETGNGSGSPMQVPLDVPPPAEFLAHALKKGYPMHNIIEPFRKEGQASPAQTGVALRDSGCRALVSLFEPSPLSARDFLSNNLSPPSQTHRPNIHDACPQLFPSHCRAARARGFS
jgi:hypothetical protein